MYVASFVLQSAGLGALLAVCVWLLQFTGLNTEVAKVTGEDISVSTKGKKMCVGFKRSMALFLLDERLTAAGHLWGCEASLFACTTVVAAIPATGSDPVSV